MHIEEQIYFNNKNWTYKTLNNPPPPLEIRQK